MPGVDRGLFLARNLPGSRIHPHHHANKAQLNFVLRSLPEKPDHDVPGEIQEVPRRGVSLRVARVVSDNVIPQQPFPGNDLGFRVEDVVWDLFPPDLRSHLRL